MLAPCAVMHRVRSRAKGSDQRDRLEAASTRWPTVARQPGASPPSPGPGRAAGQRHGSNVAATWRQRSVQRGCKSDGPYHGLESSTTRYGFIFIDCPRVMWCDLRRDERSDRDATVYCFRTKTRTRAASPSIAHPPSGIAASKRPIASPRRASGSR